MKKKVANSRAKSSALQRENLYIEAMASNGGNKRAAALAAGAKSDIAADKYATRVSQNVRVIKAIEERQAEALKHAQDATLLTAEEVLRDLANGMRFDPARMYDEKGSLLPVKDMPPEIRRELEGVEVQELGAPGEVLMARTHKVKFAGKTARREQAMKHFGLFEKDNAQKPLTLPPIFNLIGVRAK